MAIPTEQSLTGFIATEPRLSFTSKGDARFYARFGHNHYRIEDDGTFTKTETTFHDLVAYRATAERAYERFGKGDNFISQGYVRPYERTVDGQTEQTDELVARRIGHDLALTRYEVDRSPRPDCATPGPGTAGPVGAGRAQRRDQFAPVASPDAHRSAPSARANAVSL